MIKPPPLKFVCSQCGWSKVFAPKSDVITPEQMPPANCPKCGSEELKAKQPNVLERLMNSL